MSQIQESSNYNSGLKISCIVVGSLNAVVSFLVFVLMSYLTLLVAVFIGAFSANGPEKYTDPLIIAALALVVILLIKCCLDVLFVCAVVKKRPVIILAYFFMSLAISLVLTMFSVYIGIDKHDTRPFVTELVFYSFDIITIIFSYFYYRELKRNVRDNV